MTDRYSRDRLNENDENHSPVIGSYRGANDSFFELYNNQACIKNDLTRKPRTTTDSSLNRSEEDEESNLNEDDELNIYDIYDLGNSGNNVRDSSLNELSSSEEDEQNDKFDEDENNENENAIPINHKRYKQRSNSRCIHEDELLSTSFKQYAKSLPVNIPFSTNTRRMSKQDDDNLDMFSVKNNPENIAESIKALAKSVRDDNYEMFGDLPSRRFNTSEIVRDRPI